MNFAKLFAENRANILWNNKTEKAVVKSKIDKLDKTNLWTIKWVGEATVKTLLENWIGSIDDLSKFWKQKLKDLKLNAFSFTAITNFLKK